MITEKNLKHIKELVDSSGISYETFAANCGQTTEDFKRQMRFHRLPLISTCIGIAKTLNTNVDYALGLTDNRSANETYETSIRLKERRTQLGLTLVEAADVIGNSTNKIRYNEINGVIAGLASLVNYAECYHTSTDYLLGLTEFLSWDKSLHYTDPFHKVKAGQPFYLEDNAAFGCISKDGQRVFMENGSVYDIKDKLFRGKAIIPLKEKTQLLLLLEEESQKAGVINEE